jgi:hypothetical protein
MSFGRVRFSRLSGPTAHVPVAVLTGWVLTSLRQRPSKLAINNQNWAAATCWTVRETVKPAGVAQLSHTWTVAAIKARVVPHYRSARARCVFPSSNASWTSSAVWLLEAASSSPHHALAHEHGRENLKIHREFFRMGGKSRRFGKAGVLRALGSQAVQGTSVDRDCEGNRGVWEWGVHLLKIREGGSWNFQRVRGGYG